MKFDKSNMGRREFLLTAGAVSTSALAAKGLSGLIEPDIANAAGDAGNAPSTKSTEFKCAVIYSSMTGNTERVAKAIQKGFEQAAGNCELFPIKEANPHKLAGYNLIALGYPLMGPMLKQNISDFIDDLRYVGGKHIILFSTSDSGSNNFSVCVPKLKEHGLITIGYKSWHGSVYGPLGDPTPSRADGHPDATDLQEAEDFAKEMFKNSKAIYAGDKSLIPQEPVSRNKGNEPPELVGSENDTPEEYRKRVHFKLVYEQGKCLYPTCHRCMDFCPVYGIDMTVEPRLIGDPCMMCMMCDQLCPTGAIYVDPEQMVWQAEIEKYAEKGVTQIYQVYTKHPRFIIGYGRPYGYDPYTKEDRGNGK